MKIYEKHNHKKLNCWHVVLATTTYTTTIEMIIYSHRTATKFSNNIS